MKHGRTFRLISRTSGKSNKPGTPKEEDLNKHPCNAKARIEDTMEEEEQWSTGRD
jgi:hypothetical protein